MTCAEPPKLSPLRLIAHVKKKKARNGVCGAAQAIHKPPCSTRQKRKKQEMACAEPPTPVQSHPTVCGAATPQSRATPPCAEPPHPSRRRPKQEPPKTGAAQNRSPPKKKQLPMQHFRNLCIKSIKRGGRRCKKKKRNW